MALTTEFLPAGGPGLIVPEKVSGLTHAEIIEKSALLRSGIASLDLANEIEGYYYRFRELSQISGNSEVMDCNPSTDCTGLTMDLHQGIVQRMRKCLEFCEFELEASLGLNVDSASNLVADRFSSFWVKELQRKLTVMLGGIFGAGGALNGSHNVVVDDEPMSVATALKGQIQIGDRFDSLGAIFVHSKVYADMVAEGIVSWEEITTGANFAATSTASTGRVPRYLGMTVIIDDNMGVTAGAGDGSYVGKDLYHSYLLGGNAVQWALSRGLRTVQSFEAKTPSWAVTQTMAGVMHVPGVNYIGPINPADADLALAANWDRVTGYDDKLISVVRVETPSDIDI